MFLEKIYIPLEIIFASLINFGLNNFYVLIDTFQENGLFFDWLVYVMFFKLKIYIYISKDLNKIYVAFYLVFLVEQHNLSTSNPNLINLIHIVKPIS